MSSVIGALGFPVLYSDLDMPNYEKVMTFWEDYRNGKDAQIVIYSLGNTGISATVLDYRGGGLIRVRGHYRFQTVFEPDYRPGVHFQEDIEEAQPLVTWIF